MELKEAVEVLKEHKLFCHEAYNLEEIDKFTEAQNILIRHASLPVLEEGEKLEPLDKDKVKDEAVEVLYHIESMYPDVWKSMSQSCRLSLRNTIINKFSKFSVRRAVKWPEKIYCHEHKKYDDKCLKCRECCGFNGGVYEARAAYLGKGDV